MIAALLLAGLVNADSFIGQWRYDGFSYEGERYPLPNPDLRLTFTFYPDQRVRLFWSRAGETGFCEREAKYAVKGNRLFQKITWVNPGNAPDCSKDPDMVLGKESLTLVHFEKPTEMHMIFDLNGKPFDYILIREY